MQKIQSELMEPSSPDGVVNPKIPHGEILHLRLNDSPIYPGTENNFQIYVPAQYDPKTPACLLAKLDGLGNYEATVLDNLIASKEVPIMIGLGISSGTIFKDSPGTTHQEAVRFNRSYEFDSTNNHFPDFIFNEVLPAVQKLKTKDGRAIRISRSGNDHAATGASTGGIGSFTLAWQRPDQFTRVYSIIGTFVSMRGGHDYPALIRKTDPKPIRIFLEDGSTDAWNPLFGSWFDANVNMESALNWSGYDVAHAWGTHGHDGRPGAVIFPDVMRWLWRDYPAAIKAGVSHNSTLQEITLPAENWQKVPADFESAAGLTVNSKGEIYLADTAAQTVYRLGGDDKPIPFMDHKFAITGQAFGPNDTLYSLVPAEKKVITISPDRSVRTIAAGITGHCLVVTHDGVVYISEQGEHTDMPSQIWQIKSNGEKKPVDQGLFAAAGVCFSPDGSLFYAAESSTQWIYSYVLQPDGSLSDKQPFYWLHMTDIPNNSGAEDLAVDMHGNLYAATRMGIQVCDPNGRVRAILPLPTPCGPVRCLCLGGPKFDQLYATDGRQIFKRQMKVPGFMQWAAPIKFSGQGAG